MTGIDKEVQRIVREYKLTPSKLLFVEDVKQEEINTWFENIKEDLINYIHCCMEFKCGEERVNGEIRCKEQREQCKQDYSNDI